MYRQRINGMWNEPFGGNRNINTKQISGYLKNHHFFPPSVKFLDRLNPQRNSPSPQLDFVCGRYEFSRMPSELVNIS